MRISATFLGLLTFVQLSVGCGSESAKILKRYDLHLNFKQDDADLAAMSKVLVDDINTNLGFKLINLVADRHASGGKLGFYDLGSVKGHEEAVGLGRHGEAIVESPKVDKITGKVSKGEVVQVFMQISFAREYMRERKRDFADKKSIHYIELYRLFTHEIGHGLGYDHTPDDEKNVMYPINRSDARPDYYKWSKDVAASLR